MSHMMMSSGAGEPGRHQRTQHDVLIDKLRRHGIVRSDKVERAMRAVDRKFYCPHGSYFDSPQGIGYGVTISAPHMHGYALEILKDHAVEGAKVLDVGCGSGYLTACLAYMVGESGCVVGIEHMQELVDLSRRNIERGNPELLRPRDGGDATGGDRVKLVLGDGRLGWKEEAPFDAIHVGAASEGMPNALVHQLKPGGRLVCPATHLFLRTKVGDFGYGRQRLMKIDKRTDGTVDVDEMMDVMFVPLCDAEEQWEGAREPTSKDDPPMPYVD